MTDFFLFMAVFLSGTSFGLLLGTRIVFKAVKKVLNENGIK